MLIGGCFWKWGRLRGKAGDAHGEVVMESGIIKAPQVLLFLTTAAREAPAEKVWIPRTSSFRISLEVKSTLKAESPEGFISSIWEGEMSTPVLRGRFSRDAAPGNTGRLRTLELMRCLQICMLITALITSPLDLIGCNINN